MVVKSSHWNARCMSSSPSENLCFQCFFSRSHITGSFVEYSNVSQEWTEKELERRRKKGLWISDRWGGFIWLQRLVEPFCFRFGSLCALSVVEAMHVMCLSPCWKPTPAVANKNIQTMLLSLSLAQHVNGDVFFPFSTFPPFFLPSWHSFLLVALFCTRGQMVSK